MTIPSTNDKLMRPLRPFMITSISFENLSQILATISLTFGQREDKFIRKLITRFDLLQNRGVSDPFEMPGWSKIDRLYFSCRQPQNPIEIISRLLRDRNHSR